MDEHITPTSSDDHRNFGVVGPSCMRTLAGGSVDTAYPPQRLVRVAQDFGTNGMVPSICQDDLGPAMLPIVDNIAQHLGEQLVIRARARSARQGGVRRGLATARARAAW